MKRITLYLIIIGSLLSSVVIGQKPFNNTPRVLEDLYGRFINNYNDSSRIQINDSIKAIVESYIQSDSVFKYRFKNVRYLGQITSRDSSLKIINWNLVLISGQNKYFCYFIRKHQPGTKNMIYSLTADYRADPVKADTTYAQQDWYGALYYDIKPYTINGKQCWMLLGIDYGNPEISRKIIDVVSFTPGDSILFGRKWFDSGAKMKFRDVFEYASNGMMSLRFKSDSSIVFDHLVPFSPDKKNDRQYYGPDYSTDSYNFIKGIWSLIINVDVRNKE
jgi:hypothetical protein